MDNKRESLTQQDWFIIACKYMSACKALQDEVYRLRSEITRLKNKCNDAEKESNKLKETNINLQNNYIPTDERLFRFAEQWSSHTKHFRKDIYYTEIIELYKCGIGPYKIAKILKEKKGVSISYRTIISRIKKLKAKGII